MSTQSGQENLLLNKLYLNPSDFDFFQALRLLEYTLIDRISEDSLIELRDQKNLLYYHLRFYNDSTVHFPVSAISRITESKVQDDFLIRVQVSFMGLTGINAALPYQYTERLLNFSHQGHHTLRDFFDLFNHSFVVLFYRAWKKNHCFSAYHRYEKNSEVSSFNTLLKGIAGSLNTTNINDYNDYLMPYSGLFAGQVRSAVVLESMLSDYFELPVKVLQFQKKWLSLHDSERSVIGRKNSHIGQYHQLGCNIIIGQKRLTMGNKFRIYIGPIDYKKFTALEPHSSLIKAIIQMTRRYVNLELSFDIQLEIERKEIPPCIIQSGNSIKLGWNTWIKSRPLMKNSNAVVINLDKRPLLTN